MKTGIIILAHGSKISSGNEGLHEIVGLIREIGDYEAVEAAFLQLASPGLEEAVNALAGKNVGKIIVMPLLLFSGNHVCEDIPRAVDREKTKYPDITFEITRNIGPDKRIAQIAHERIGEVINER